MAAQRIRIGFIGLSKGSCWAVSAHLPYLKESSKFLITALLNSSEDAAKAAIASHNLATDTKAYGSAEKFAEDGDIDLVVCSVRVDKHYPVLKPILEKTKAKAVHCEWPLGKNLAEAEELLEIAERRGIKTIIGLQGRRAPTASVVKNVIESGKIGRPLSVTITGSGYNLGAEDFEEIKYISDINFGGNLVTIHFSHTLDTITQALGQIASYSVVLDTQRKKTLLRNKPLAYKPSKPEDEPVKIVGEIERTSHDQILLQGHLQNGAVFTFHMRGGQPFPDTPGLEWRVYGEKGEIRVTTPGMNLHYGGPGHVVQVHDHGTGKIETVEAEKDEWDEKELPWPARGPARIYEAFAEGRTGDYADWRDAVRRHRLVEEMYGRVREGGEEREARYML